jgi:hypothetical protein
MAEGDDGIDLGGATEDVESIAGQKERPHRRTISAMDRRLFRGSWSPGMEQIPGWPRAWATERMHSSVKKTCAGPC